MRRFEGYRPNPPADYIARGIAAPADEPQYEGVVFSDGTVCVRWMTEYQSHSVWSSWEPFFHVHGHPEYGTRIDWLDSEPPTTAERAAQLEDDDEDVDIAHWTDCA